MMRNKKLGRQVGAVAGRAGPAAPADLTITVRDRRFDRAPRQMHWWLAGDPIASAWFAVLSATFPRGEAFFVESVKACREGAPPRLDAAIRAFVAQEINHTREHLALNKAARAAGYDLGLTDANVGRLLDLARERPAIENLAATAALEHYTAIIAHEILVDPVHLDGSDPGIAALWRWHAVEEIEHKGVAFDVWFHATQGWSGWQRWRLRARVMGSISTRFVVYRAQEALDLLAQDGLTGWRTKLRLLDYLLRRPGILRRVFPMWLAWFRPGFHPWQIDDRALIVRTGQEFPDSA